MENGKLTLREKVVGQAMLACTRVLYQLIKLLNPQAADVQAKDDAMMLREIEALERDLA